MNAFICRDQSNLRSQRKENLEAKRLQITVSLQSVDLWLESWITIDT